MTLRFWSPANRARAAHDTEQPTDTWPPGGLRAQVAAPDFELVHHAARGARPPRACAAAGGTTGPQGLAKGALAPLDQEPVSQGAGGSPGLGSPPCVLPLPTPGFGVCSLDSLLAPARFSQRRVVQVGDGHKAITLSALPIVPRAQGSTVEELALEAVQTMWQQAASPWAAYYVHPWPFHNGIVIGG